jgi:hypothetical protein
MRNNVTMAVPRLTERNVDIVIRQTGGVLGMDRRVELGGSAVVVSEQGNERSRHVQRSDREAVEHVAEQLIRAAPRIRRYKGPPVSDTLTTEVLIKSAGGHTKMFRYATGDTAPADLRSLVSSVVALAKR